MGIESYEVGKSWEDQILDVYHKRGYATIKLGTEIDGTVADILCIKNNKVITIEAKHIKSSRLYYKASGLRRKRDELDNYCDKGNSVLIFVKSDVDGQFLISWLKAKEIFNERKYITIKDGIKIRIGD